MAFNDGVEIYNYLISRGASPLAAAAYVGHFAEETGWFDPAVARLERRGDGGVARGIAQWHPDRWNPLERYAVDNGIDPRTWRGQVDMMLHESQSGMDGGARRAWEEANRAQTLRDAVAAVAHFERSAGYTRRNPAGIHTFDKRLAHAQRVMGSNPTPDYANSNAVYDSHSGYSPSSTYGINTPATNSAPDYLKMYQILLNGYGSNPYNMGR